MGTVCLLTAANAEEVTIDTIDLKRPERFDSPEKAIEYISKYLIPKMGKMLEYTHRPDVWCVDVFFANGEAASLGYAIDQQLGENTGENCHYKKLSSCLDDLMSKSNDSRRRLSSCQ